MYLKKYTRDEDFVAQHEQRRKVNESSKKKNHLSTLNELPTPQSHL